MSAQNTYNTNSTGTRFKSHIPGTQAHRERKFTDHQATASYNNPNQAFGAQGGPQYNASGAGFTNAPANPVASNAAGPGPGPAPGRAPVPATMGERADELHGRRHFFPSTSHGTTSAGTAKPHMGDKALGSTQATLGRATHNPALEQAGMERKTFGDPKHRPGGANMAHPVTQRQGYTGTQPAQQASTQPGAGY